MTTLAHTGKLAGHYAVAADFLRAALGRMTDGERAAQFRVLLALTLMQQSFLERGAGMAEGSTSCGRRMTQHRREARPGSGRPLTLVPPWSVSSSSQGTASSWRRRASTWTTASAATRGRLSVQGRSQASGSLTFLTEPAAEVDEYLAAHAEVLAALPSAARAGAYMLHLAGHANVVGDAPGLSYFELADGNLTVEAILRRAGGRPAPRPGLSMLDPRRPVPDDMPVELAAKARTGTLAHPIFWAAIRHQGC